MDHTAEEFSTSINETILKFNAGGLSFDYIISELQAILDNLEEEHPEDDGEEEEEE